MINEINAHFKKDIEKAEQHYKKIAEFNKQRTDKSEKAEDVVKIEEETSVEEDVKEIVITDISLEEESKSVEAPVVTEETTALKLKLLLNRNNHQKMLPQKNIETPAESEKFISPKDNEATKKEA